jgi:hypothetical protein
MVEVVVEADGVVVVDTAADAAVVVEVSSIQISLVPSADGTNKGGRW